MNYRARISVFGGRDITKSVYKDTIDIGRRLAKENYLIYCGGGEGVMEAIAKGVNEADGMVVGILKGMDKTEANDYIHIPVSTGIGIGRNAILAYNCDVAVAISGKYGTLSEIAYAFQLEKPVVGYGSWDIEGIHKSPYKLSANDRLQIGGVDKTHTMRDIPDNHKTLINKVLSQIGGIANNYDMKMRWFYLKF